jgi:regulator of sigma D
MQPQTELTKLTERRGRTREVIGNLIAERQALLVAYCEVAGLEPYHPDKPVRALLQRFCQLLVDYVAMIHFELYNRIAEGTERRGRVLQVAAQVYPRLAATTDSAIEFNDRYEVLTPEKLSRWLPEDLSELGQTLAARFELEDRLFESLLARR